MEKTWIVTVFRNGKYTRESVTAEEAWIIEEKTGGKGLIFGKQDTDASTVVAAYAPNHWVAYAEKGAVAFDW